MTLLPHHIQAKIQCQQSTAISRPQSVDPEKIYRILGAHWYAEGLYIKDMILTCFLTCNINMREIR